MLTKQSPLVDSTTFKPPPCAVQSRSKHASSQSNMSLVESVLRRHQESASSTSPPHEDVTAKDECGSALKLHHSIFEVENTASDVLGKGSYGTVYAGVQRSMTSSLPVAIKTHTDAFLLEREVQLYQYMWRHKKRGLVPQLRIPRLLWEGTTNDGSQRVMVMDRLGTSLDQLFDQQGKLWGHSTVCWIGCEALRLLEGLHTLGVVHRDLKPDNFAIGFDADERHRLYIFDFGLSSQYLDKEGEHRPMRTGLSLIGTQRYASLANHEGKQQSRRDDLESLGYVLWCFSTGTLPWKHAVDDIDDKSERNRIIGEAKRTLDLETIPSPFKELIQYARGLDYDQTPDYIQLFHQFNAHVNTASTLPDWFLTHAPVSVKRQARTRKQTHAQT